MILGLLIRTVLELCRRRGMRVPDLSRLRRREPRVTSHLAKAIANSADNLLWNSEKSRVTVSGRDGSEDVSSAG